MSRPPSIGADAARPRVRVTKTGKSMALVALAVLIAALNTANNLLYLLVALFVGMGAVSWWMARRAVVSVHGALLPPAEVRAGDRVEIAARVASRSPRGAIGLIFDLGEAVDAVQVVPALPESGDRVITFEATPERRGALPMVLSVASPFPFAMLEAARPVDTGELLVLPRSRPGWPRPDVQATGAGGGTPIRRAGRGAELLEIRDYRDGDESRSMDWKATARLDRPMVREMEREPDRRVTFVVDPTLCGGTRERAEQAVEAAISRAAGAAETLGREGWRLRLVAPGTDVHGGESEVLRALARLEYREGGDEWRPSGLGGETCLEFRSEAVA